jgi:hypothetical protein
MTNGGDQTAFLTRIAALNPRDREEKPASRPKTAPNRPHQGLALRGQEVPERRKAGHEVEGFIERRGEGVPAGERQALPSSDPEHSSAEIEPYHEVPREGAKDFEHRARWRISSGVRKGVTSNLGASRS